MARPGKNVVDLVVARLPPPDKLKSGGGRSASYDKGGDSEDDSSIGYESAVADFAKALGIEKVRDMEAAVSAMKDLVTLCMHDREEPTDEGDEE